MRIDVVEIDEQIKFLREQASRLRDLAARPGARWAEANARKMDKIIETLTQVRREFQMTTVGDRRLTDD